MSEEDQYLDNQRAYREALIRILDEAGLITPHALAGVRDLVAQRDGSLERVQELERRLEDAITDHDSREIDLRSTEQRLASAQRMLIAVRTDKRNELAALLERVSRSETERNKAEDTVNVLRAHVRRLEENSPRGASDYLLTIKDQEVLIRSMESEKKEMLRQTHNNSERIAELRGQKAEQRDIILGLETKVYESNLKIASMQEALDIPGKSEKTKELKETIRENEADIRSFIQRLNDSQQFGAQQSQAVRQYKTQVEELRIDLVTAMQKVEQLEEHTKTIHVDRITDQQLREIVQERFDLKYKVAPAIETPADADLLRRLRFANRARGKQGEMIYGLRLEVEHLHEQLKAQGSAKAARDKSEDAAAKDRAERFDRIMDDGAQPVLATTAYWLEVVGNELHQIHDAMEKSNKIREEEMT